MFMLAGGKKNLLLGLLATALAASQLGTLSTGSGGGNGTPPPSDDGKVRVYVYRPAGVTSKEFRPSIFVDENDTARLQSGRNVVLALPPGTHIFRSTDKKDQISLDLKPGEKYYVRVEVSGVAIKGRGKLVLVMAQQGMGEFGQTKPDDSTMIKNRMLVAPEFIAK
jgi:hypothetical protein